MSYPHFHDDEGGIRVAQQALHNVRGFLQRRTGTSSMGGGDSCLALRFQLENLEDMLREITDARFARSLSEGTVAVAGGDVNVENLRFIVTTAREMQMQSLNRVQPSDGSGRKPYASSNPASSATGATLGNAAAKNDLLPRSSTSPSRSTTSRVCLERADEYYSSESADTSSYALSVSEGEEELFLPPHPVELVGSVKGKQRATSSGHSEIQLGSSSSPVDANPYSTPSPESDAISLPDESVEFDAGEEDHVIWLQDNDVPSRPPSPSTSWSAALIQYMIRESSDALGNSPALEQLNPNSTYRASIYPQSKTDKSTLQVEAKDWDEYHSSPACSISDLEHSDSDELQEYIHQAHEDRHSPCYSGSSSPRAIYSTPCVACGDPDLADPLDFLTVPCGHFYCRSCITDLISVYVKDESLHPLRCCKTVIPVPFIQTFLLGTNSLSSFQDKYEEYSTPFDSRTYCPQQGCSRFLKPQTSATAGLSFVNDQDCSKTLRCSDCSVWVCISCKELAHPGEGCYVKQNTILLHELAKEKEWQTCSNCRSVVERIDGCLHMICRCGFEFCYRCGTKFTGPGMCGH